MTVAALLAISGEVQVGAIRIKADKDAQEALDESLESIMDKYD